MTTITIALSEDQAVALQERAARLGIAPEDLARAGVEVLLRRPADDFTRDQGPDDVSEEEFDRIIDYVLTKNAELYHRLA